MRNQKKFAAVLAAGVLSASMCMPALAASGVSAEEQKILNKMESSAAGFGVTDVSLYASYYSQAESWLASGEVDLTASQVDAVLKAIDQAAGLLQQAIDANGAASAKDFTNIVREIRYLRYCLEKSNRHLRYRSKARNSICRHWNGRKTSGIWMMLSEERDRVCRQKEMCTGRKKIQFR